MAHSSLSRSSGVVKVQFSEKADIPQEERLDVCIEKSGQEDARLSAAEMRRSCKHGRLGSLSFSILYALQSL